METEKEARKLATLTIVRHGQTEWNLKDILQGQLDSPLTPTGIEQARSLAREFHNAHFDAIFTSDLLRARRTAEIAMVERELAITTSKLLRERNWGRYDGVQADRFREEARGLIEQFSQLSEEEQWSFKYYDDIESYEEIFGRFITFLREVAAAYPGKNILVISHLDVIRTLLIHLGKRPIHVDNMAYVVIKSDGVEITVERTKGIVCEERKEREPAVEAS
jgi:broad specificity phosphatase PhoE